MKIRQSLITVLFLLVMASACYAEQEQFEITVEADSEFALGQTITWTITPEVPGDYEYTSSIRLEKADYGGFQPFILGYTNRDGQHLKDNHITFTPLVPGEYWVHIYVYDPVTKANGQTNLNFSPEATDDYPALSTVVERIAAQCCSECSTEYEKALWIHRYVRDTVKTYIEENGWEYHHPESALIRKTGVCESHAYAFAMLCKAAGLEADVVSGGIAHGGHAWGAVRIDGNWVMCDTLWDNGENEAFFGMSYDLATCFGYKIGYTELGNNMEQCVSTEYSPRYASHLDKLIIPPCDNSSEEALLRYWASVTAVFYTGNKQGELVVPRWYEDEKGRTNVEILQWGANKLNQCGGWSRLVPIYWNGEQMQIEQIKDLSFRFEVGSAFGYDREDGYIQVSANLSKPQQDEGTLGDNLNYSWTEENNTLEITGTGRMADFTSDDLLSPSYHPWGYYHSNPGHYIGIRYPVENVYIREGVQSIGEYAFHEMLWSELGEDSSLRSVTIEDGVLTIGGHAFAGAANLDQVVFGQGLKMIGDSAFEGCANLTPVAFPDSLIEIGNKAFKNCSDAMDSVAFQQNLRRIGVEAFSGCAALKEVTLCAGLEQIGQSAFSGTAIEKVLFIGTEEEWNAISIGEGNENLVQAERVYYPSAAPLPKPEINVEPEYSYGQSVRIPFDLDPNAEYYEVNGDAYVEYDEEAGKGTLVFSTYGSAIKAGKNTLSVKAVAKNGYLDSEETVLSFTVRPMELEVIERHDWTYYRSGERVGIAFLSMIDNYYSDRALYTVTVTDPNGEPVQLWGEEAKPSFFDRKSEDGQKYWMVLFDQYDWFDNGYGPGMYTITVTAYDEGLESSCVESRQFELKNDLWGGFEYSVNGDGSVTVTGVVPDENNEVVIPGEINGMRVSTIAKEAFESVDTADVLIKMPKTVLKVEDGALPGGSLVETPKNSPAWFYGKAYDWALTDDKEETVTTIELPRALSSLSENALTGINTECVILPEGCSVDSGALADCQNLMTVVFHENAGTLTDIFGDGNNGNGVLIVNGEFGNAESLRDVDF